MTNIQAPKTFQSVFVTKLVSLRPSVLRIPSTRAVTYRPQRCAFFYATKQTPREKLSADHCIGGSVENKMLSFTAVYELKMVLLL